MLPYLNRTLGSDDLLGSFGVAGGEENPTGRLWEMVKFCRVRDAVCETFNGFIHSLEGQS